MLLSSTTGILRISETFGNSAFNVEIGPFEGSWLCYKRTGVEPPARMLSGLAQCFPTCHARPPLTNPPWIRPNVVRNFHLAQKMHLRPRAGIEFNTERRGPVIVLPSFRSMLVTRRTDCIRNPQFWAEEGTRFFCRGARTFRLDQSYCLFLRLF